MPLAACRRLTAIPLVATLWLMGGCASLQYAKTPPGRISGDLDLKWVSADCFVFQPNSNNPLRFERANGKTPALVEPKRKMYTDGGSIPRVLWAFPQLSPWGYAPAYILHDWLFEAHHCAIPGEDVAFGESAQILAEAIKTEMEADPAIRSKRAEYLIYQAVRTPIARYAWDHGRCSVVGIQAGADATVPEFAPVLMRIRNGVVVATPSFAEQFAGLDDQKIRTLATLATDCPASGQGN